MAPLTSRERSTMASKRSKTMGRALVVGAAGGLGVHVVSALSAAGWEVIAVDRRPLGETGRASLVHGKGISWHVLEGDAPEVGELMRGCAAVINAAATVSISESYQALAKDNVE